MLYDPKSHQQLTDEPWKEERVRSGVRAIVADAEAAYNPDALWPASEWDAWEAQLPLTTLYVGAAGVIWGLDALRRRGHGDGLADLVGASRHALEAWRAAPDFVPGGKMPLPPEADAALWTGETGVLLVAWLLQPDDDLADAIYARVRENARNEANELMWGAPGTMLAAHVLHERTGDPRWRDAWQESAGELLQQRAEDGLWTQQLYGRDERLLGPAHGFSGNVLALRQGGALDADGEQLARQAARRTAIVENGRANWPPVERGELAASDGAIRLQWCHGAPGIVAALAEVLDEDLLLAGAELAWEAGPSTKGPSLCHGSAGTGYAFLKVFARTGDERWLERARRFAVHALVQVESAPPRYSLWTGGIGAALLAADCVDARTEFPTIDSWD